MKREREESTGEEAEEPTAQRARDDAGADESADAPPNTEVAATGHGGRCRRCRCASGAG